MANERGLADEPLWEAGCLYVALLREPRLRYVSQYLHLRAAAEAYLAGTHPLWPAELRYMRAPPSAGVPSFASVLSGGAENRIPSGFRDSFQTRALAGASSHGLPEGGVGAEVAERARSHLSMFDWVGTVEALSGERAAFESVRLSKALGWGAEEGSGWANASRRGSRSDSASFLASLDSESRRLLETKVGHDAALYAHAQALAAAQSAPLNDRAVAALPAPARESCDDDGGEEKVVGRGPFRNWSHGCRSDGASLVAACAVLPAPRTNSRNSEIYIAELVRWLASAAAAGVGRVFLHVEGGEGADGTNATRSEGLSEAMTEALVPFLSSGLLSLLSESHPPPRYGLRERGAALEARHAADEGLLWAGYREVQGRCLSEALLEGACWLLHAFPGLGSRKLIQGRFTKAGDGGMALPDAQKDAMCLRLWPSEGGGRTGDAPRDFGAL